MNKRQRENISENLIEAISPAKKKQRAEATSRILDQVEPVSLPSERVDRLLATVANNLATPEEVASHKRGVDSHTRGDRHRPGRAQLNVRVSAAIKQQIKEFCAKANIELQTFIELAASHFIEHVASHKTNEWLAHDDVMMFNTENNIIMCYQRYTGNKWKPGDDALGAKLKGIDPRIIELGILQTLLNFRGGRINSFAYFLPEIETIMAAEIKDVTLDAFLRRRRQQWEGRKKKT